MANSHQAPKGTRDFYPADMAVRRHIEAAWRGASIRHGFDEIDGPTFEHLGLYTVKSGEGIVNELFSFRRAGGENDYALRPEFTPTLARMVAARGSALPVPTKWFAVPNFFRAERPQRGRLREFFQWNVDLLGLDTPGADSEVIGTAIAALEALGLKQGDVTVKLSHRGAVAGALRAVGVPDEQLGAAFALLDRRDKLPPEEFAKRAAALGATGDLGEAITRLARATAPASAGLDGLARDVGVPAAELGALEALRDALRAAGIEDWCQWDCGIVRGLAYYTGVVFEIHAAGERAVAGGGRYDGLVELFGGPHTPAVGFGMGDVVLGNLLRDKGLLPADGMELLPRPDVFVVAANDAAAAQMPSIVSSLRRAGLHARHSYKATRNVGKLLGEAGKSRARFAVILGDGCVGAGAGGGTGAGMGEVPGGIVQLKDLGSGEQRELPMSELISALKS